MLLQLLYLLIQPSVVPIPIFEKFCCHQIQDKIIFSWNILKFDIFFSRCIVNWFMRFFSNHCIQFFLTIYIAIYKSCKLRHSFQFKHSAVQAHPSSHASILGKTQNTEFIGLAPKYWLANWGWSVPVSLSSKSKLTALVTWSRS